jgi:hypothetical protein
MSPWRMLGGDPRHLFRQLAVATVTRVKAAPAVARILVEGYATRWRDKTGQADVMLHAGEHKTGTTSIQSVIVRQRSRLARQGLFVLRSGQGTDGAHHRLIHTLIGQQPSRARMALLRAELAQAGRRPVLISSEAAKKAIVEGKGDELVDALRAAGASGVRILLWVRSPFGRANSSYSSQTSRLGLAGARFADFLRAHDAGPGYRYDRVLRLSERSDVELIVKPYSASARRSIVLDFADALGVTLGSENEPRHNASFGPIGLEAIRTIVEETGPLSLNWRRRLSLPLRQIARSLGEDPFWGIEATAEAALATADSRTEEFALAVWGRSWREAIGEERRPLNVFDPGDPDHRAQLEAALAEMRSARTRVLC